MGACTICKREDHVNTEDNIHLEECFSSTRTGVGSFSGMRNKVETADYHNNVIVSKVSGSKLLTDKGGVSGSKTARAMQKKGTFAAHAYLSPREEEKLHNALQTKRTFNRLKNEVKLIRRATVQVARPKVQLIRDCKINIKETQMPLITFDPSNLVLENKEKMLDRYKILKVLGKGSFGEVHQIMHINSQKLYAMKIINKSIYDEVDNIVNEIEILKSLDHPNIVRLHEFSHDATNYYLVTEYCAGGELFNKIIELRRFDEHNVAKIMEQLLSAVCYCHNKHIVHRDLKLENLVLEGDSIESNMKIIDFGTSAIFKPREHLREITGSAYYMAPEVLQGKYNEKCDLWSCGVIMYMLLSGSPPFNGITNEEIMHKILDGHASFTGPQWNKISRGAIELIRKMLKYSPDSRISARAALSDTWLTNYEGRKGTNTVGLVEGISNLKSFRVRSVMQKAVLSYIAAHAINLDEEKKLREIFLAIDKDKNGTLSLEELVEGYMILFKGDMRAAKEEAKKTMEEIDTNRNGTIDYNEFLMANMTRNAHLNNLNLKLAFDFFDEDNDGSISSKELQRVFGGLKGAEEILKEADLNNDGEISFDEFVKLMSEYIGKLGYQTE